MEAPPPCDQQRCGSRWTDLGLKAPPPQTVEMLFEFSREHDRLQVEQWLALLPYRDKALVKFPPRTFLYVCM